MDSQMLSPGDTGYDPTTDPDSPQYGQTSPNGAPPSSTLPSIGGLGPNTAPTMTTPGGIDGQNPLGGLPSTLNTANPTQGDPRAALSVYLNLYPNNPQQAIDAFNKAFPGNSNLAPVYYPGTQTIGLANGTYLVAPHTGANNADSWYTQQRGNESGGGGGFNIDPSYLAPFTEKFQVPGDPNNPASAAFAANPKAFELPTEADLFSSPGFQGAQTAARNAVVNSNASKGLINSGGSIYDLANVASGLEGQQYNDLVNQRANAYGINLGAGQGAFNNAWQMYLGRNNIFRQNQDAPFNKLSSLANLGLNAASQ